MLDSALVDEAISAAFAVIPSEMSTAASLWFGNNNTMDVLSAFYQMMCGRSIFIGILQREFHACMEAAGCFVPVAADRISSALHMPRSVMQLNFVSISDIHGRSGTYAYDLTQFIVRSVLFFLSDTLRGRLEFMTDAPCDIANAFMYFTTSRFSTEAPARQWFLSRFLRTSSDDYKCWSQRNNATALIRNVQYFNLAYLREELRMFSDDQLSNGLKQAHRDALLNGPSAQIRECESIIERISHEISPTTIMTFYTLFICTMMQRMPNVSALCCISDGFTKVRRLFELCYSMLIGLDLDELTDVAAQQPDDVLRLLSDIAEEMRTFLIKPSDLAASTNEQLKRIVLGAESFKTAFWSELEVRRAVTDNTCKRSELMVHYVDTTEELFSSFATSIFTEISNLQLRLLKVWLRDLPAQMRPDVSRVLSNDPADAEYRAGVNSFFAVLRFPTAAHLFKLECTLAFYESIWRTQLFSGGLYALISTDSSGPYVVMPRRVLNVLRVVMLLDVASTRNAPKTVPLYPKLARFWVSQRVDPDDDVAKASGLEQPLNGVNIDDVSTLAVLLVLSHWLYIPSAGPPETNRPERIGLPQMGTPSFEFVRMLLHRVVALLFRSKRSSKDDLSDCMPQLNAVRSFIMIHSTHYISEESMDTIIADTREHHEHQFRSLAEVLEAIAQVNTPGDREDTPPPEMPRKRSSAARRPGPKRPRGRPSVDSINKSTLMGISGRISLAILSGANADRILSLVSDDNLIRTAQNDAERTVMINHWIYEYCVRFGQRKVLKDFVVQVGIVASKYKKPLYTCSPKSVDAWTAATMYTQHHVEGENATPNPFQRDRYRLRPMFQAESYDQFVIFMQRMERFVCVVNSETKQRPYKPSAVKKIPGLPDVSSAREASLVRSLEEFYKATDVYSNPIPVAACFDSATERFTMLCYEQAVSIIGLVPYRPAGHAPISASNYPGYESAVRSGNDASAPDALSSVAVGMAALLTPTFDELRAAHKVPPNMIYNAIVERKAVIARQTALEAKRALQTPAHRVESVNPLY